MRDTGSSTTSSTTFRTAMAAMTFVMGVVSSAGFAAESNLQLSGTEEIPGVVTKATGHGNIVVSTTGLVSGSVTTKHMRGTQAHVHEAAKGQNGPVVFALSKDGETYRVPEKTQLTAAQMTSYKAGNLYVNVHSAAYPDGEVRAQLKP